MTNILFLSESELFRNDLKEQLALYAPNFEIFEQYAEETVFDIAIVDELPKKLRELQSHLRQTPIIFLGNEETELPVSSLIVKKPFKLYSLFDTVLSQINLFSRRSDTSLSFGDYYFDSAQKTVTDKNSGNTVKLTERETMILNYLYKSYPKPVSKNRLLSEVWQYSPEATTHTVETHIYRLRQKVEVSEASSPIIITGESGYMLNF